MGEIQPPVISADTRHSSGEFKNLWVTQGVVREWVAHPKWDSYDVLPVLYTALHTGKKYVPGAQNAPTLAEIVRNTTAHLPWPAPGNLLAEPENVYLLVSRYSRELDEILRRVPRTTEQTIHDAALAYYVFDRIHPFPEGNGRIGRGIVKRVYKGGGLKDPIFHDQRWYGGDHSAHLEALERVDDTNNLVHLELFLADALSHMYDPQNERDKHDEVKGIMDKKTEEARQNGEWRPLSDIWDGFAGLHLYGIQPPLPK